MSKIKQKENIILDKRGATPVRILLIETFGQGLPTQIRWNEEVKAMGLSFCWRCCVFYQIKRISLPLTCLLSGEYGVQLGEGRSWHNRKAWGNNWRTHGFSRASSTSEQPRSVLVGYRPTTGHARFGESSEKRSPLRWNEFIQNSFGVKVTLCTPSFPKKVASTRND